MSTRTMTDWSRRFRASRLVAAAGLVVILGALSLGHAWAQEADPPAEAAGDEAATSAPADDPVDAGANADADADAAVDADADADTDAESDPTDEAIDRLMRQRQAPPTVAPTQAPDGEQALAGQVEPDRSVLGVAPREDQPTLRREGEFIVNRRGHLRRSSDGAHTLFVFEADDRESPETPMILQPCQLLETMEDLVQQRGDQVTFILSGQVHTYRGANYLLPTMMRIDVARDEP